jgi:hypothetical protein
VQFEDCVKFNFTQLSKALQAYFQLAIMAELDPAGGNKGNCHYSQMASFLENAGHNMQ